MDQDMTVLGVGPVTSIVYRPRLVLPSVRSKNHLSETGSCNIDIC